MNPNLQQQLQNQPIYSSDSNVVQNVQPTPFHGNDLQVKAPPQPSFGPRFGPHPQVLTPQVPPEPNPQNSQLGLNPSHDAIYERLRQLFMSLHKQGVPGIDQLLSALTKTHVGLTGQQPLGKQPASPQNPTPAGYYSGQ